ncbi:MAG: iron ABC transporter substrate-binding protein, partial [Spirochaetota bacterium]
MKSPVLIFLILFLMAIPSLLVFSSGGPIQTPESLQIKDLAGRQVEVPLNVDRIVCAGPGALRLIVYLEAVDRVIGVEDAEKRWGPAGRPYALAHPG